MKLSLVTQNGRLDSAQFEEVENLEIGELYGLQSGDVVTSGAGTRAGSVWVRRARRLEGREREIARTALQMGMDLSP